MDARDGASLWEWRPARPDCFLLIHDAPFHPRRDLDSGSNDLVKCLGPPEIAHHHALELFELENRHEGPDEAVSAGHVDQRANPIISL